MPCGHRDRHDGDRRARARRKTEGERRIAETVSRQTRAVEGGLKLGVRAQALSRTIIGNGATDSIAGAMRSIMHTPRVSRTLRPGPGTPKARAGANMRANPRETGFPVPIATQPDNRIVYFPACPTRMFGANPTPYDLKPATEAMIALLSARRVRCGGARRAWTGSAAASRS